MTYRTILAAASGGTACAGTLELACRLARRFAAHVEGFHVRVDPNDVVLAASDGFGVPLPTVWLESMTTEGDALSARTKAAFDAAVERHGLVDAAVERHGLVDAAAAASGAPAVPSAVWREALGQPAVLLPDRARFFDLAVLGRSERVVDRPASTVIEATLLNSGRPVLLAPERPPAAIGDRIAFGWDGSPTAVRALAAALPFIEPAGSLVLITIGAAEAADVPSVLEYLAWRGVAATHRAAAADGKPGLLLLAEAGAVGADLLVMGGYGQPSWRELLFGGTTHEVIGAGTLPVLLSH